MPWRKGLCARLTPELAALLGALSACDAAQTEELRVRRDQPVELVIAGVPRETALSLDGEGMQALLCALTGHSAYAYERQMAQGYIPLPDGHRAGVCGRAVTEQGRIVRMTEITDVAIRIARAVPARAALFAGTCCMRTGIRRACCCWGRRVAARRL